MIRLRRMSLLDCWRVIPWRNASRQSLRTPTDDTRWSQLWFYLRVILNPWSPHRYRSVYLGRTFVGMVGLVNLTPESGEISLITDPHRRGQGLGRAAVQATLSDAFGPLGLKRVWGEVYAYNAAVPFWRKLVDEWGGEWTEARLWRDGVEVLGYKFRWRA